jgi:hypothetical protein
MEIFGKGNVFIALLVLFLKMGNVLKNAKQTNFTVILYAIVIKDLQE